MVKAKRIVSDFPVIVHQTRPKAWQHWQRASSIQLYQVLFASGRNNDVPLSRAYVYAAELGEPGAG